MTNADASHPELSARDRRELLERSHGLKARLAVGRAGVAEAVVAQVRQAFAHHDLLKVRLQADDRGEADRLAAELAEAVPCTLIRRVGRVALLYRPPQTIADPAPAGD